MLVRPVEFYDHGAQKTGTIGIKDFDYDKRGPNSFPLVEMFALRENESGASVFDNLYDIARSVTRSLAPNLKLRPSHLCWHLTVGPEMSQVVFSETKIARDEDQPAAHKLHKIDFSNRNVLNAALPAWTCAQYLQNRGYDTSTPNAPSAEIFAAPSRNARQAYCYMRGLDAPVLVDSQKLMERLLPTYPQLRSFLDTGSLTMMFPGGLRPNSLRDPYVMSTYTFDREDRFVPQPGNNLFEDVTFMSRFSLPYVAINVSGQWAPRVQAEMGYRHHPNPELRPDMQSYFAAPQQEGYPEYNTPGPSS